MGCHKGGSFVRLPSPVKALLPFFIAVFGFGLITPPREVMASEFALDGSGSWGAGISGNNGQISSRWIMALSFRTFPHWRFDPVRIGSWNVQLGAGMIAEYRDVKQLISQYVFLDDIGGSGIFTALAVQATVSKYSLLLGFDFWGRRNMEVIAAARDQDPRASIAEPTFRSAMGVRLVLGYAVSSRYAVDLAYHGLRFMQYTVGVGPSQSISGEPLYEHTIDIGGRISIW